MMAPHDDFNLPFFPCGYFYIKTIEQARQVATRITYTLFCQISRAI